MEQAACVRPIVKFEATRRFVIVKRAVVDRIWKLREEGEAVLLLYTRWHRCVLWCVVL